MDMAIDWNDPEARYRLGASIGAEAYARAQEAHFAATMVATVNGWGIRPVQCRFGRLFSVHGTGRAFSEQADAEQYAATLPQARKGVL